MKTKRVLALVGVVLLVAMYVVTLILAFFAKEYFMNLFVASVALTIVVPITIHIIFVLKNVKSGKSITDEPYSYKEKKDF